MLVEIRHDVPFLDAVAKDLAPEVDLDTEIAANPGPVDTVSCPRCATGMTRFGYLGTNRVFLDRCERCRVLWHDGTELVTTALLHARTALRGDDRRRFHEAQARALQRAVDTTLLARAVLSRGFVSRAVGARYSPNGPPGFFGSRWSTRFGVARWTASGAPPSRPRRGSSTSTW